MKILVVDDQDYNRQLLSYILEDEGYDFVEAKDGKEACEIAERDAEIDLILMDVTMPEMDGMTACAIIKKHQEEKHVPIIFVTALDDSDILAKCLDAGGDDFVPKPINESILLAKIKAHGRTQDLYQTLQTANKKLEYHRQVMDREHLIVERIFNRGASRIKTNCANITKYTSPMSMFNGDIILEAPSPSGGVYNIVGDFTGHGLAASIGTLPVTEIFYRLTEQQTSIATIAKELNRSLVDLLPDNMFFCAAITYLDSAAKQLSLWAGGMNDILWLRENGSLDRIGSEHMPLGILMDEEFDDSITIRELTCGDRIYIHTDGVNEATNADEEYFGLDRLENLIAEGGPDRIEALLNAVRDFQQDSTQTDDITLMEIKASPIIHLDKEDSSVVDIKSQRLVGESFPWRFSLRITEEHFANMHLVDQIMTLVGDIQGMELHREKIFTIISELYSNALEHGILGLDSSMKETADGFEEYYKLRQERIENTRGHAVELVMIYKKGTPDTIEIKVSDSGEGFDYENTLAKIEEEKTTFGRGVLLLKSLCTQLEYSNNGTSVKAVYEVKLDD